MGSEMCIRDRSGALAALDKEGLAEISELIDYYMGNAKLLREAMEEIGFKVHGGTDAPYVFVDLEGKSSWDMFSELLESAQVLATPRSPMPALSQLLPCSRRCLRRRRWSPSPARASARAARASCASRPSRRARHARRRAAGCASRSRSERTPSPKASIAVISH